MKRASASAAASAAAAAAESAAASAAASAAESAAASAAESAAASAAESAAASAPDAAAHLPADASPGSQTPATTTSPALTPSQTPTAIPSGWSATPIPSGGSATPSPAPATVAWRRVALFYGIAFGGAATVAGVLAFAGPTRLPPLVATAAVALLYMPLPVVAGLVVERVARRRPLFATEWARLRARPLAVVGRVALATLASIALIVALAFGAAWLAGTLGVPGHGVLLTSDAALRARLAELSPGLSADAALPPLGLFLALTIVQGVLAGFTINGLFALGEEYGWRGVLADELRPLGHVRSNLLIGVLWGLWHAPIIMLGHNYGPQWGWGILVMVTWTVPLGFVLSWSRDWSGSLAAPAALHGAFNGVAGLFTVLIVGGTPLVNPPAGVVMAVVIVVVALVLPRVARPAADYWARP